MNDDPWEIRLGDGQRQSTDRRITTVEPAQTPSAVPRGPWLALLQPGCPAAISFIVCQPMRVQLVQAHELDPASDPGAKTLI